MKTLMIAASALALAAPAFAQTAAAPPATAPAAATGSTTESTSVTTPAADGSATTTTTATTTTPAPPPVAAPATPQQAIAAEFPTHDKDGNGMLSTAEFDVWLTALQEQGGTKLTPAQRKVWLEQSFAKADSNKSKTVDLAEITTFLLAQHA